MKKLNLTIIAAVIAGLSGSALAAKGGGGSLVVDDDMSRRGPGSTSGSGDTVEANCGGDFLDATAYLTIDQKGGESKVRIDVANAPDTHFTVWTRIKGSSTYNGAGSPWTSGGATPLCSGTEFTSLNANSPWNNAGGSTAPLCNSFSTVNGTGTFSSTVNFPVVGGAYPFQQSGGVVANGGGATIPDVPTAIVDPRTGNGGPFMIRVVSHCTDGANHGLSPATREAFFQYP
jgi:hypothetical protein